MWWFRVAAAGDVCNAGCDYPDIATGLAAADTNLVLMGVGARFAGFTYSGGLGTTIVGDGTQTVDGPIGVTSGSVELRAVTVDGTNTPSPLVKCTGGGLTLTDVVVDAGSQASTIEVAAGASLNLFDTTVTGFVGPAVSVDGGTLTSTRGIWALNDDAALSILSGAVYLNQGSITGHSRIGEGGGGAIDVDATGDVVLSCDGVTFEDNAGDDGGAIGARANGHGVEVTLARNTYLANTAENGGALYLDGVALQLPWIDESFEDNAADAGADVYLNDPTTDPVFTGSRHCRSIGAEAVWVQGAALWLDNPLFVEPNGRVISVSGNNDVFVDHATVVWSGGTPLVESAVTFQDLLASATGGTADVGSASLNTSVFDVDPGVGGVTVAPIEWLAGTAPADAVCGVEVRPARAFAAAHDLVGAAEGVESRDLYDADADGDLVPFRYDCADDDPTRSPDAPEICGDDIDQDCDGALAFTDADGDGHGSPAVSPCGDGSTAAIGDDCLDDDPGTYPGAFDVPCDGVDQDCVGGDDCPYTGTTGGSGTADSGTTPGSGTGATGADTGGADTATAGGSDPGGGDTGIADPPPGAWSVTLSGGCATGGSGAGWLAVAVAAIGRRRPR